MARRTLAGILWLALLAWASGILWFSSLAPEQLPDAAFVLSDKVNHFVAFAIGGWLAASAFHVTRPRATIASRIVLAVIVVAAFGALDETLQAFTPGRTGRDIHDWIADFLGAVAGALLILAPQARLSRRAEPRRPQ